MNFGVVGLNWPGQQHIKAIRSFSGEAALTAVCDRNPDLLDSYKDQCGTYTEMDEFLTTANVDSVILAVPHHLHADLTVQALQAGKHVIIEKPMARTEEECRRMLEAADRYGRELIVAQNWRYTPWVIAAKAIVGQGELGTVRAVRTDWLLPFHPNFPRGSWIYDGELAGGGALISLAIHNIDALRFIFGEIEQVFNQSLFTDDWSTGGAENWAMSQFRFESGAIGQLFTGYTPFYPPEHGLLHVYGDKGTMFFGPWRGETGLWIRSEARSADPNADYERVDSLVYAPGLSEHPQTNMMRHVLDCFQRGERTQTDGRDSVNTVKLLEKFYESSGTGAPVKISG